MPRRSRRAWLTACSAALALSACGGGGGGGPALADGRAWAERVERAASLLEAGDRRAAGRELEVLRLEVIAAINTRRVPQELQEPLLGRVNEAVELPSAKRCRALARWLRERAG